MSRVRRTAEPCRLPTVTLITSQRVVLRDLDEHQAGIVGRPELAVDRQPEGVPVEPAAAVGVSWAEQDAAAEHLHAAILPDVGGAPWASQEAAWQIRPRDVGATAVAGATGPLVAEPKQQRQSLKNRRLWDEVVPPAKPISKSRSTVSPLPLLICLTTSVPYAATRARTVIVRDTRSGLGWCKWYRLRGGRLPPLPRASGPARSLV